MTDTVDKMKKLQELIEAAREISRELLNEHGLQGATADGIIRVAATLDDAKLSLECVLSETPRPNTVRLACSNALWTEETRSPKLSEELAARIRKAFGPCSVVFECWTVAELLTDYAEHTGTIESWVATLLKAEDIHADRDGTEDWPMMKQEIVERLGALGVKVA